MLLLNLSIITRRYFQIPFRRSVCFLSNSFLFENSIPSIISYTAVITFCRLRVLMLALSNAW